MTVTGSIRRSPATRKKRRLQIIVAGMTMLAIAVFLVLTAFQDNILFFYSPTDVMEKSVKEGQSIRLGGVVAEGSVKHAADGQIRFDVTDFKNVIVVRYTGLLPDLFREGQGVITEGWMEADGSFHATSVLAKHDENYMPKEVADALKRSGEWKGESPPVEPEK
jgi:cytochrome c-type biogenesis protein CcmE